MAYANAKCVSCRRQLDRGMECAMSGEAMVSRAQVSFVVGPNFMGIIISFLFQAGSREVWKFHSSWDPLQR